MPMMETFFDSGGKKNPMNFSFDFRYFLFIDYHKAISLNLTDQLET